MKYQLKLITLFVFSAFINTNIRAQKTIALSEDFNKIIVSPHIEAVFIKGNKSSIELKNISAPIENKNRVVQSAN